MANPANPAHALLLSAALLATACAVFPTTAFAIAQTSPPSALTASTWQRVLQAQSWQQQAYEVNAFLRALATNGRRPADIQFDARDIATGRAVGADDPALLQRPQAHEVTLSVDGRFYVFRPLSRASVEPLLRR